jgi:anti-sigma B factor antagonist
MSFRLKVKKKGTVPILMVYGDITGNNIGKMTAKLKNMTDGSSSKIGIDLSNVSFIDSHGLGVFVYFYRRLKEHDRTIVFIKPSEFIVELFSGSNLDRIFTIADNEEAL